jgi:hypothetical protein
VKSFCTACGDDCTDAEHVPATAAIARGLRVASDAIVCADCSARTPRASLGEVVYRALLTRLAAHGFDGAPALSATGDALLTRRPLTRDVRDLACACWLAADGHYDGAAEALALDGDAGAWVAHEAAAQGVEVQA